MSEQMNDTGKNIVVGLDGVPCELIERFTENGVMPETAELVENGTFRRMTSSIPDLSSVAWSSIITGRNPGEHGVFGFTHVIPGTYTISFPDYRTIRAAPFWEREPSSHSVIINVPFTYPAPEMNGSLISGFVAPELEKAVYPDRLLSELNELDYRVDVDTNAARKSMDYFLNDLFEVLEIRRTITHRLWEREEWDLFMLVLTGCDRLMHYLWDACDDPEHEYHRECLDFFRNMDEIIGEIRDRMDDRDQLTIISDHGFGPRRKSVNVNALLRRHGFLEVNDAETSKKNLNAIKEDSRAFALDPGRIYLNMEDQFPRGTVKQEERPDVLRDLKALFRELEHEGTPVIDTIFPRNEVYHGEHLEQAPDLVLLGHEAYSLKGDLTSDQPFDEHPLFTGKHTYRDAIFIDSRANLPLVGDGPLSVEDVPVAAGLADVPEPTPA